MIDMAPTAPEAAARAPAGRRLPWAGTEAQSLPLPGGCRGEGAGERMHGRMKGKGKTEARAEAAKLQEVRGQTGLGWCLGRRGFLG